MIMDGLQLHLLTNHLPIIGTLAALLVVVVGMIRKNDGAITTGLIVYVVMALAVVPAYLSGEEAEERVEHLKGIDHDVIHEHEEMAEVSLWITALSGLVGLGALITRRKQHAFAPTFAMAFVVVAVLAFVQAARTGHEGGKIRRPDLGAPIQQTDSQDAESDENE
jgi:asparagine N-glycosylation enzyme membrane subunit Stt3